MKQIFDKIRELFNPEIISTYNDIYANHLEALIEWKRLNIGLNSTDYYTTFEYKKRVADHKIQIIDIEKKILEEKEKKEYERIKAAYPCGTLFYESIYSKGFKKQKVVINKESEIAEINPIILKYFFIKDEFALGFEEYKNINKHKRNNVLNLIKDIVEHEDEIEQLEFFAQENTFHNRIESSQNEFKSFCRNIHSDILDKWGCYKYSIPFPITQRDGNSKNGNYIVWQHYCMSYSFSNQNLRDLPEIENNNINVSKLITLTTRFSNHVFNKVINYVVKIKENYKNVVVLLENSNYDAINNPNTSQDYKKGGLDYHFKQLKTQLESQSVEVSCLDELKSKLENQPIDVLCLDTFNYTEEDRLCCVIIDLITTNEQLFSNCLSLIKKCSLNNGHTFLNIAYISLMKELDEREISELIEEKERIFQSLRREEESSRKMYEKDLIRILQDEQEDKERFISIIKENEKITCLPRLKNAVSKWGNVKGIPYCHFFHYYPTRFSDVSKDSEVARHLIWDFKDGSIAARDWVIKFMEKKLTNTFNSDDLKNLTLVCIPASNTESNNKRFRTFASALCSKTGMRNGFSYISLAKDRVASRLGGTDSAQYMIDGDYFKGANVVLFDDVVTRGRSMDQMRQLLNQYGAIVICAISIGHTYSDYYGDNRLPHPLTGKI